MGHGRAQPLFFSYSMLGDDQSATSSGKPKPVSGHDKVAIKIKTTMVDARCTKEMNDNVRLMRELIVSVANATILQQISRYEKEVYELKDKLLDVDKNHKQCLDNQRFY